MHSPSRRCRSCHRGRRQRGGHCRRGGCDCCNQRRRVDARFVSVYSTAKRTRTAQQIRAKIDARLRQTKVPHIKDRAHPLTLSLSEILVLSCLARAWMPSSPYLEMTQTHNATGFSRCRKRSQYFWRLRISTVPNCLRLQWAMLFSTPVLQGTARRTRGTRDSALSAPAPMRVDPSDLFHTASSRKSKWDKERPGPRGVQTRRQGRPPATGRVRMGLYAVAGRPLSSTIDKCVRIAHRSRAPVRVELGKRPGALWSATQTAFMPSRQSTKLEGMQLTLYRGSRSDHSSPGQGVQRVSRLLCRRRGTRPRHRDHGSAHPSCPQHRARHQRHHWRRLCTEALQNSPPARSCRIHTGMAEDAQHHHKSGARSADYGNRVRTRAITA